VDDRALWDVPFFPGAPGMAFEEWDDIGLGTVGVEHDQAPNAEALRIYVGAPDGTPWTGPMTVGLSNRRGEVFLSFDGANAPRNVVNPAQYDALIRCPRPCEVRFMDSPAAGVSRKLP